MKAAFGSQTLATPFLPDPLESAEASRANFSTSVMFVATLAGLVFGKPGESSTSYFQTNPYNLGIYERREEQ